MFHRLVLAGLATLLLLAGCASPTTATPSIPVTLSGGGTVAVGTQVNFVANATYSGSGTLTYKWYIGSQLQTETTKNFSVTGDVAITLQFRVEVTDGTLNGSASTSVTWQ